MGSLFAFETFDQIKILNNNIHVKKSGFIVTKQNLTPEQAIAYFKENKTSALPEKVYMLNNDYTAVTWLFYQIQTDTNSSLYLDVIDPYADYCTMYTFRDSKLTGKQISGNAVALDKRTIQQMPVRFQLENGDVIYAVHIKAHISTFGGISLGDEYQLNKHWYMLYVFAIFVFGVFVSLFAYNFFLFISTKDTLYLYYLLYTLGFYGIVTITIGALPFILGRFNDFYLLIFTGPSTKFLEIIGLSLFALKFLELTIINKKTLFVYLTTLLSVLILYLSGFSLLANIMFPLVSGFSVVILYLGISSYNRGYQPAKYFIVAMGVSSALTAVTFLAQVGLVPMSFFNNNISSIALIWDMPMLSFALAYRLKLLEDKNRALEKEQKSKAKFTTIGETLGNIAHQWRQPLAEISLNLSNMEAKSKYSTLSKDELEKSLCETNRLANQMSKTLGTFQVYFNKKPNLNSNFQLEKCINDAILFLQQQFDLASIEINTLGSGETMYHGNEDEIFELMLIILGNAKDVLVENKITKPKIDVSIERKSDFVIISIEDNGGGIGIEPIDSIFEPYTSTKGLNGMGIGLYTAKNIIENKMGGKITASNTKDGAKFEIKLPRNE